MEAWRIHPRVARSPYGVVATQNVHASTAAAQVLEEGGNAVDAAVTAALTLGVVEPWLNGLGGGGFMLAREAATGTVHALDFNMVSSRNLDRADYPLAPPRAPGAGAPTPASPFGWPAVVGNVNVEGPLSICVPGAIAGYAEALARLGTIPWSRAVAPALEHARRGLQVDWYVTLSVATAAAGLARDPVSAATWLPGGFPPLPKLDGTPVTLRNDPLVATLERLIEAGPRDAYEGDVAASVADDLHAAGSRIDLEDLRRYRATWRTARLDRVMGADLWTMPGASGGPSLVRALRGIEAEFATAEPIDAAPIVDARTYAALVRHVRAAYEHRLTSMGGTTDSAGEAGDARSEDEHDSCTTHVSVVDRYGNVVALTSTLLARFGSKVTLPSSGILMNDGVMWFDTREGHPNGLRPSTRPLANMCPTLLRWAGRGSGRDGTTIALGAAGGRRIAPAITNLVTFLAHAGLSLDEAARQPRVDASSARTVIDPRVGDATIARVNEILAVDGRGVVHAAADEVFPAPYAVASCAAWDGTVAEGVAHGATPWAAVGAPRR